MIFHALATKVLRFVLPKILDHLIQVFKLDKVLAYVEEDNALDHTIRELEDKIIDLESKMNGRRLKKGEDNVIN